MSETSDPVYVHINGLLQGLPSTPLNPPIFRVRDNVRCLNEKIYDPELLSIGPLHHGKDHLKKMEQHKLRYLKLLLKRTKESSAKYVKAMRSLEKKARECYAEPLELSPDEFVQMLLLDGCFIIELIRKSKFPPLIGPDDTIFRNEQVLSQLRHDLILVENQIPFFVLDQLFTMIEGVSSDDNIQDLFQLFIFNPSSPPDATPREKFDNIDHLLGLVHKILCSSLVQTTTNSLVKKQDEMLTINCATELQEAGVMFEKYTENLFLKIDFTDDGVLKMPRFYVYDGTESFLRNIMAYEKCFTDDQPKYLTDYAFLMQCLINSPKDVQILRCCGVITNFLGDDDMVCSLFNRFGKNIITPSYFCYTDIFGRVNKHCSYRRNRWKANLRQNYFNGPWKKIAFAASAMLLLSTLTQTVFLVLSYTNPHK